MMGRSEPETGPRATRREHWSTDSEEETRALGRSLARELAPDGTALLTGDLGAGKTVLACGIAEGLGIDAREVQSPTFTLMREHLADDGRLLLVHLDLYRLEPEETFELGLDEVFAGPGVKVVEWAERLPMDVPGALRLELRRRFESGREIHRLPTDPGGDLGESGDS